MLPELLLSTLLGYVTTALIYYFNHRCIYHGKPRGPEFIKKAWRFWASFHLIHHKHWKQNDPETGTYVQVPNSAKILGLCLVSAIVFITMNPGLGAGIMIFFVVYGIRHGTIHGFTVAKVFKPAKKTSKYYRHHMSHHMPGGIKYNHSGVHPLIDRMFGTYHDPEDIVSQFESRR